MYMIPRLAESTFANNECLSHHQCGSFGNCLRISLSFLHSGEQSVTRLHIDPATLSIACVVGISTFPRLFWGSGTKVQASLVRIYCRSTTVQWRFVQSTWQMVMDPLAFTAETCALLRRYLWYRTDGPQVRNITLIMQTYCGGPDTVWRSDVPHFEALLHKYTPTPMYVKTFAMKIKLQRTRRPCRLSGKWTLCNLDKTRVGTNDGLELTALCRRGCGAP